jgi:hypothetical protein
MSPSRLTPGGSLPPPAEYIPAGPLGSCDAAASGSEDALVRLVKGGLMLCLCGHHADQHELAMTAAGWVVIWDNRRDTPLLALAVPRRQDDGHRDGYDSDEHGDGGNAQLRGTVLLDGVGTLLITVFPAFLPARGGPRAGRLDPHDAVFQVRDGVCLGGSCRLGLRLVGPGLLLGVLLTFINSQGI